MSSVTLTIILVPYFGKTEKTKYICLIKLKCYEAYFLQTDEVEKQKIVGIIDREGGLINEEGYSFEEISQLFLNRNGNQLAADNMLSFEEINSKIWDLNAEIFIPAAASRLIRTASVSLIHQAFSSDRETSSTPDCRQRSLTTRHYCS